MDKLASPELTPTSQVQGGAEGNGRAMTARGGDVPVSTQPQPTDGVPK